MFSDDLPFIIPLLLTHDELVVTLYAVTVMNIMLSLL